GELEATMLHSYLRGARLRSWLSHPDCPNAVQECKVLLDHAYGNDNEYDSDCSWTRKSTTTPPDLYNLIHKQDVMLQAHIRYGGVVYSRIATHVGNSLIMFHPSGNRSLPPVPASIKYIYKQDGQSTFAVCRQCPLVLNKGTNDPFACYPHFPAKTYSRMLSTTLEKVEVSWVMSHCTRWPRSDDHVVILTLSQV
ncbi:hypothetical protein M404DRAFT_43233, partial [Pisolithus tinctorius Marx 270]